MAQDGEVALLFQPLLGLAANFSGISREPSGRSDDRGLRTQAQQIPGDKGLTATPTAAVILALFAQVSTRLKVF
jgi:hypothetical protein